jgi:hypothetical protein
MAQQLTLIGAVPSRSQGVLTCPECQEPFLPYKRAEGRQVYCTPACRSRAWKRERGGKRARKAQAILDRLRVGPATTLELVRVGGVRFGARLLELRAEGHRIETENHGEYAIYRLDGKP